MAAALGCYHVPKEQLDGLLLRFTVDRLASARSVPGAVLDYGCGAGAKLLHRLQQQVPAAVLVGSDPCIASPASTTSKTADTKTAAAAAAAADMGNAQGALLLTGDCSWAAAGAGGLVPAGCYDVVVCSLVLCTVPGRAEYVRIVDDLAAAVKPGSGRLLLAMCNPMFTFHGSTPFQQRSTCSSRSSRSSSSSSSPQAGCGYESVCCWRKQLLVQQQQQQQQGQPVQREDVHRPLQAVLHDLARRGFQLEWVHQTPSANLDRPDEFSSDFLLLSLMQVDLPQHPLAEVVVVVDPHPGPFLRHLAAPADTNTAGNRPSSGSSSSGSSSNSSASGDGLPALLQQLQQLLELSWVDRVVVAGAKGNETVQARAPGGGGLWQVTHLCWRGSRRGMLFNDVIAICHVCSNQDAIIVTLDADDMLLQHDALRLVWEAHTQGGHDFVTAGHIRTDKTHCGPGYNTTAYDHSANKCNTLPTTGFDTTGCNTTGCVTFAGPHRQRQLRGGGNVWQHLRSFRKALFDAVPDARLCMWQEPQQQQQQTQNVLSGPGSPGYSYSLGFSEQQQQQQQQQQQHVSTVPAGPGSPGYYYELANDWAFCIPMAELAVTPGVLPAALYLYEPSWPRQDRAAREAVIGAIMCQPPLLGPAVPRSTRRIVAVVGDSCLDSAAMKPGRVTGDEQRKQQLAEQVGRCLVDAGHRVLTGGLGGVMSAALKGARSSCRYRPGDTIAILPGDSAAAANPYADIVIPTGLGEYRNGIVARADGVIAIGGGAGTLQEVSAAWSLKRPLVVLDGVAGSSGWLGGRKLDGRGAADRLPVLLADSAEQTVSLLGFE
ncbi:hypothetical protein OEZ85_003475 [Tetradesmus obliquus]|uniref:Methyltransferase type 11 domain-containing protein n=1 Tax=Tetradesmus obliquus TaxID=3088 RepID=A0ABY8UBE5_TETOB|nr:hypothetical protein OEZ85_003475 [Tetradesmus obliquus]